MTRMLIYSQPLLNESLQGNSRTVILTALKFAFEMGFYDYSWTWESVSRGREVKKFQLIKSVNKNIEI